MNNKTVLAFMAHPDDAEICMGGSLARFVDSGYDVHIGLVSIPDNRELRLAEAEAGARILGATLHLISVPDCPLTWQVEDIPVYALVAAFDALQRKVNASILFTHWDGDTHYDHVLVSRATLSVSRRLQVDLYMCEQPNQYAVSASAMQLTTFIDVSGHMDRKIASIRAHRSQTNSDYEEHVRTRARAYGERIGCEYAEVFRCVIQRLNITQ